MAVRLSRQLLNFTRDVDWHHKLTSTMDWLTGHQIKPHCMSGTVCVLHEVSETTYTSAGARKLLFASSYNNPLIFYTWQELGSELNLTCGSFNVAGLQPMQVVCCLKPHKLYRFSFDPVKRRPRHPLGVREYEGLTFVDMSRISWTGHAWMHLSFQCCY